MVEPTPYRLVTAAIGVGARTLSNTLQLPQVLEAMCRAHDQEDCAQRGEPDPWADWIVREHIEQNGQTAHDEWVAERRAAMLCALQAVGLA